MACSNRLYNKLLSFTVLDNLKKFGILKVFLCFKKESFDFFYVKWFIYPIYIQTRDSYNNISCLLPHSSYLKQTCSIPVLTNDKAPLLVSYIFPHFFSNFGQTNVK